MEDSILLQCMCSINHSIALSRKGSVSLKGKFNWSRKQRDRDRCNLRHSRISFGEGRATTWETGSCKFIESMMNKFNPKEKQIKSSFPECICAITI